MRTRLLLVFIIALVTTTAFARRVFYISDNKYDCGMVSDTIKEITHEFVVRNISDQPQAIRTLVISCNCLTADYATDSVPVGDSAIVKITLDLSMVMPGEFNKPVNIKDWSGNSYYLSLFGNLVSTSTPSDADTIDEN